MGMLRILRFLRASGRNVFARHVSTLRVAEESLSVDLGHHSAFNLL